MEETKIINNIEDVEAGDIVYYKGAENGARVVEIAPGDDKSSLAVETPEEYKPFDLYSYTAVWLQNSFFRYAIRTTQNKLVEKRLPAVQDRQGHIFETQKGTRIIYSGVLRGWMVESFLGDKRLLELLDPSQFPLKDMMEEES